ncbi:PCYCGC motif-containing (lipo)protein [Thalassobacillus sp. C254]|uniref:PCYCGC motif-containing (lipo)protein n=1 Tax=Thalassobacillus sp. C254 TaxID=1225341 RepID=UPI0006CFA5FA|nr:PCYCGC motif-containing (lipo)protein [Thalassobacillus sp. C254]
MKWLSILMLAVLLTGLAGCGNENADGSPAVGEQKEHGFDILETTASAAELPEFLEHTHEDISSVYAESVHHKDLLEHIPCYCGCYESAGHRNVYDCFVNQVNEDGTITWDDHGMKCGVCLEIAYSAVQMSENGASDKEIRDAIDDYYNTGDYPEATPTPQPEA